MTILYLHGLESKLSDLKREELEKFGEVIAPDMNYNADANIFVQIIKLNQEHTFDVVIGSSMGGFMGYYFANFVSIPALLFNPALPHRSVEQNIPEPNPLHVSTLLHFVLGGQDIVMNANGNLKWIAENRNNKSDLKIALYHELEHRISFDVFEKEVGSFFQELAGLK